MNGTRAHERAREAVGRYAAEVRRHLADLPPDQVDDLTDDLEADLADAIADGADGDEGAVDPAVRFGTPGAYAEELRAAAGLPHGSPASAKPWPARVQRLRSAGARAAAAARRQPWAEPVARAATDLRPLWWVVRAWIGYQALMWVVIQTGWLVRYVQPDRHGLPQRTLHWAILLLLVLVSVQWGRGRWGAAQLPRLSRTASVVALVLVVPVAVFTYESRFYGAAYADVQYVEVPVAGAQPEDGVWVDGVQVSNLFVYDAAGEPLADVQVFDDRGRPVRTTTDDGWSSWSLPGVEQPWAFVPAADDDGRLRWNVYPLQGAPYDDFDWSNPDGTRDTRELLEADPRTPPLPFAKAPTIVPGGQDEGPGEPTSTAPGDAVTAAP
ncbi:HAAS signaling domain-containing protein [Cellulomonas pakistanensis]|uniref:Uncharacterized protein n=1 Tax=Cellulomonas pakistanensis TaxID=992287 RepID=A0A919PBQ8_9CELL|nr:hypothetical protein [Cellulomonas pakistanensis]GIG36635.1 hypothetical protein Cpa01nite_20160 [Cellulomonas pakistanensis]